MKSVLISIHPKWCDLIANGKKTIEVRKTRPKIETPFKCYIYCTKPKMITRYVFRPEDYPEYMRPEKTVFCKTPDASSPFCSEVNGNSKVIGEFVCDKIDDFYCASVPYRKENNLGYEQFIDNGVYQVNGNHEGVVFERNDRYIDSMLKNKDLEEMCLSAQEIFDYIGLGKHLFAWHIADLKIYDKPRELSEFGNLCRKDCLRLGKGKSCEFLSTDGTPCNRIIPLKRPPQSWCYVEVD